MRMKSSILFVVARKENSNMITACVYIYRNRMGVFATVLIHIVHILIALTDAIHETMWIRISASGWFYQIIFFNAFNAKGMIKWVLISEFFFTIIWMDQTNRMPNSYCAVSNFSKFCFHGSIVRIKEYSSKKQKCLVNDERIIYVLCFRDKANTYIFSVLVTLSRIIKKISIVVYLNRFI